jgi:ParB/RepB/Spo0J family partition protein
MPLDHPRNAAEAALLDPAAVTIPPTHPRSAAASDQAEAAFAASFDAIGQIEPIIVRPDHAAPGRYILVHGARRLRLAAARGISVAAVIRADLTEAEAARDAVAANTVRAPLAPVDTWRAMLRLQDLGWPLADAAAALGFGERHARKLLKLGQLHPDLLAAIERDGLPNRDDWLAAVANAAPEAQAAALARQKGALDWWKLAQALAVRSIPRDLAVFDVATAGVAFVEDLFAEPGSPGQFVTHDVAGFVAAQKAALQAEVEASKGKLQLAEISKSGGIALPKGFEENWSWRYAEGKPPPRGTTGLVAVRDSGAIASLGIRKKADPKKPAKVAAGVSISLTSREGEDIDTEEEDAAPPPPKAKPRFTHAGMDLIAAAKTDALRAALRDRKPPPPARALRCLLLALAANNVRIGGPHAGEFEEIAAVAHAASDETAEGTFLLCRAAAEALARILTCGQPTKGQYDVRSGDAAEHVGALLDAITCLPRLDTPEILATASAEALRALAEGQGLDPKGTAKGLRERLAGKLDDMLPPEAQFVAPAPTVPLRLHAGTACAKEAGRKVCDCGWKMGEEGASCDLADWRHDLSRLGLTPEDVVEDGGEGRVWLFGPVAAEAPPPDKPAPTAARPFDCAWNLLDPCAEHGTTRCINQCPKHAAYLDWCATTEGKTVLRRSGVEQAPAQRRAGGKR